MLKINSCEFLHKNAFFIIQAKRPAISGYDSDWFGCIDKGTVWGLWPVGETIANSSTYMAVAPNYVEDNYLKLFL